MYHVGQPTKRRHPIRRALIGSGVLAALGLSYFVMHALKPDTAIQQSSAKVTHVSLPKDQTKVVGNASFRLSIPNDWKQVSDTTTPGALSWQGTTQEDSPRRLDVYVDNVPTTLGLNRLLPVQVQSNRLLVSGSVSDNCTNFTDKSTANALTGTAPAKWGGVSFLCDVAHSIREVVGIGSVDGINSATITGPSGVTHRYFLAYTDHSAQADFDAFNTIITSFEAL